MAIEVPAATKLRLGLDDLPSWVITSEANAFLWTGPDIRFVPSRGANKQIEYGFLPYALTEKILNAFRANLRAGKAKQVSRDP